MCNVDDTEDAELINKTKRMSGFKNKLDHHLSYSGILKLMVFKFKFRFWFISRSGIILKRSELGTSLA